MSHELLRFARSDDLTAYFVQAASTPPLLSELALETFFPADDMTAERMRSMAAGLE